MSSVVAAVRMTVTSPLLILRWQCHVLGWVYDQRLCIWHVN